MSVRISHVIAQGDRLTAFCLNVIGERPCGHSAGLEPRVLAAAACAGAEIYSPSLQRRLVCRKCGTRGASFILQPPIESLSAGGRIAMRRH